MARPTKYKDEYADAICEVIATSSKSMKTICEELKFPVGTVLAWLSREPKFQEKYARAKEWQAEYMAEEMLDIADDGSNDFMTIVKKDMEYTVENKEWVNRSRLRVDTRKWIASKLKPKKYGDKTDITTDGKPLEPGTGTMSDAQFNTLIQKINEAKAS